jgi:hypothetical protein
MLLSIGFLLTTCSPLQLFTEVNGEPSQPITIENTPPDRAEQVMKALAAAYPDIISDAEYIDGDWTVCVREERFFYAGGRLIPEANRSSFQEYAAQPFYTYEAELPEWRDPTPEESGRMRQLMANRNRTPLKRSPDFWDAVYRAHSHDESYSRIKTIKFLNKNVNVHYMILEELALVEEQLLSLAATNSDVQKWIDSVDSITAWNWRSIANTQSRSFHSYGSAIDLLPRSLNGLATYWLWTADANTEWWAVPYKNRLHPPQAVVKVFEQYGFLWGGKWTFYDTMHFEYRPEILLLNNIPMALFH